MVRGNGMNQKMVQHLSSVEYSHRTNSLAIDLSTIYGRENIPNRLEMFKFIDKQLGVKAQELVNIQDHPFLPLVFVKVENMVVLERIEKKMQEGVKVYGRDIVLYGWRCDIPLTTVKINGSNPDTSRERIMEIMGKYGKVIACDRGKVDYFKDKVVSDGTWILRMRPEQGKGLPSIIYYQDEGGNTDLWSIIFDGKVSMCYKCGVTGHRGDQCRAARPRVEDQGMTAPVGVGTYCDVVKKNVVVQWQGMTNKQVNLNKQISLKPKPIIEKQKVKLNDVSSAKLSPSQTVSTGTDFCLEKFSYMKCVTKLSNRFAALEDEGAESDDGEVLESGDELGVDEAVERLKRKNSGSKQDNAANKNPRLEPKVQNAVNQIEGGGINEIQSIVESESVESENMLKTDEKHDESTMVVDDNGENVESENLLKTASGGVSEGVASVDQQHQKLFNTEDIDSETEDFNRQAEIQKVIQMRQNFL